SCPFSRPCSARAGANLRAKSRAACTEAGAGSYKVTSKPARAKTRLHEPPTRPQPTRVIFFMTLLLISLTIFPKTNFVSSRRSGEATQISGAHLFVVPQFVRRARHQQHTGVKHIGAI